MIRFACPGCTTVFTVGDDKAGKTGRCPKCGVAFAMPADPSPVLPAPPPPPAAPDPAPPVDAEPVGETVDVQPCPRCRAALSVEASDVGADIECPTCRTVFRAARADAPPPPGFVPAPSSKLIKLGGGADDEDDDGRKKKKKRPRRDEDDDDDDDDERPARRRRARRASRPAARGGTLVLRRLGVLSVGKMNALLGFCVGLFYAVIGLFWLLAIGGLAGGLDSGVAMSIVGFGLVGLIIAPFLAALGGFIGGIIWAALYNLAAGMVGGIECEFE